MLPNLYSIKDQAIKLTYTFSKD